MPCDPKYLPPGPITVEISARCFQRRFLLRPDDTTNDRLRGVIAYATQRHPQIDLHLITFQSNHYHALLTAPDETALRRFAELLQSRIAYEVNRIRGRTGDLWHNRYTAIPVTPSQLEPRLRYLLAQGIEHGLYLKPEHNPCVHSLGPLTKGEPMTGAWLNRTAYHQAGGAAAGHRIEDFVRRLTVRFAPLPGWDELTLPQQQARWRALVKDATAEAAQKRELRGIKQILGAAAMRTQDPFSRPKEPPPDRPPPPPIFGDQKEEAHFLEQRTVARVQHREALEHLVKVWPICGFPPGMYPPSALEPLLRRRE